MGVRFGRVLDDVTASNMGEVIADPPSPDHAETLTRSDLAERVSPWLLSPVRNSVYERFWGSVADPKPLNASALQK